MLIKRNKTAIDYGFANNTTNFEYDRLAVRIKAARERQIEDIIDIGLALKEAKALMPHGTWGRFLSDARVGMSSRQAELLMQIASKEDSRELALLGVAKAAQLLRLKKLEQRNELRGLHDLVNLQVSKIRQLIDEINGTQKQKWAPNAAGIAFTDGEVTYAAGMLHLELADLSIPSIDKAYKQMARLFHPDMGRTADHLFMARLTWAREFLKRAAQQQKAA